MPRTGLLTTNRILRLLWWSEGKSQQTCGPFSLYLRWRLFYSPTDFWTSLTRSKKCTKHVTCVCCMQCFIDHVVGETPFNGFVLDKNHLYGTTADSQKPPQVFHPVKKAWCTRSGTRSDSFNPFTGCSITLLLLLRPHEESSPGFNTCDCHDTCSQRRSPSTPEGRRSNTDFSCCW